MLFNKSTGMPKVETDVFSLASLIAWLETMPGKQTYDYMNCRGECLYGQYTKSHSIGWLESGACGQYYAPIERKEFCLFVYQTIARQSPCTFSAALSRAKALI